MDWRFVALPLLLVACAPDTDGDGLTNRQEEELSLNPENPDTDEDGLADGAEVDEHGTDPLDADTDDDRLPDGMEIELGTDPFEVDTDGDGYLDGDEVNEESDPTDASDVIYQGGWPYNGARDEIGGGNRTTYETGRRLIDAGTFRDQFRDQVSLYDFYNEQGIPVIIDVSARWCPPCQAAAVWLDGDRDHAIWGGDTAYYDQLEADYAPVREAIHNGDLYWVTIIGEGMSGGTPAENSDAAAWYNDFPTEGVPVLADRNYTMSTFVQLRGWPTHMGLTPDLRVVEVEAGLEAGFQIAMELLSASDVAE